MKLYSTITSERATKGQGGNDFLKVVLYGDKKNGEQIGSIFVDNHYFITIKDGNNIEKFVLMATPKGNLEDVTNISKGKRQKGETHYGQHIDESGNAYCLQCKKFED